jgi:hypothetical protein
MPTIAAGVRLHPNVKQHIFDGLSETPLQEYFSIGNAKH